MKKEFELTFANGWTIQIFEHDSKVVMGLVNSNGFWVTDSKLTETEVQTLKEVVSNVGYIEDLCNGDLLKQVKRAVVPVAYGGKLPVNPERD